MRKFKDIEVSDAIKAMKDRLKENRLSLLIGAGASHCACSLYPLWNELLADMVAFLYADELKSKGVKAVRDDRYYCHYKLEKARRNSSVDVQDVVRGIIAREGTLRIPEQFERRTGLRESVEAYIESHTPKLQDDGTVTLFDNKARLGSETEFLVRMMDVRWNSVFTTNYDNLIGYVLEKNGISRMTESNCASDLSLRNMRETIVKLHGSIDFEHTSVGFDSDNHRKYIISQKDYDEYPVKHEAFMQLMRISLLKDCLCLVGFSGKDPNFISWINWVRDIIARDSRTIDSEYPKAEDIKVFFIDAIDEPEDEATMQYFENHRIYRIRLTDENVSQILCSEFPDGQEAQCSSKILEAFFNYLGENDNHIPQETNSLWSKAYRFTGNRFDKIEIDEDAATRLLRSSPYLRIVKGTHFQSYFVDEIRKKDVLSELEARMALLALEQMQGDYGNDYQDVIGKIENTLAGEDFRKRISRLRNRHDTLCDPFAQADGESDMVVYERCARLAFTFRFKELKEALMSWHPSEDFVIKKLVLLRIVDADAVNGILSQSLLDSIYPANERFRATQIAEILSGNASGTYSLDEFADLSQHSIYSLRDWYFGNLIAPGERITAYGSDIRLMPVSQSPFRFYRGQSIYYSPCIPTLYRTNNLGDISLEDQIVANRIKTSEFVLLLHTHPVYINVCQNINGNPIALAQHYGLATEYLDITNSKWVAAFFASTGYDFKTDTYYPVGREFRDGYGVMYISKEFKQGNIPDAFFDKNGVIGYQYFERPSKQSSFGYAMSLGEDFNECDYFDSVFFRHDIEASKVVFDMSYKQNRFIPKDSLSKLARIILESTEVTNSAVQLCQEWFYPDEGREFFKAVLDKKHWRIREIDSPIVEFSAEELEIEWKQWMEFGIADINARTLPVIPIAYIQ